MGLSFAFLKLNMVFQVYDGGTALSPRMYKGCEDSDLPGVTSTGNQLFLLFVSDNHGQDQGFQAAYTRSDYGTLLGIVFILASVCLYILFILLIT